MAITTYKDKNESYQIEAEEKHMMLSVFPIVPKGKYQIVDIEASANDPGKEEGGYDGIMRIIYSVLIGIELISKLLQIVKSSPKQLLLPVVLF